MPRSAQGTKAAAPELGAQLAVLETLPLEALRTECRRLYGTAVPTRLSRDLLTRGIAHRLQEAAHGGLRAATRRSLEAPLRSLAEGGTVGSSPSIRIKPGATLVRSWRGQTHTVQVLDVGFEYQGERFASLSLIAQRITGAHWSGLRFFGQARLSVRVCCKPTPKSPVSPGLSRHDRERRRQKPAS